MKKIKYLSVLSFVALLALTGCNARGTGSSVASSLNGTSSNEVSTTSSTTINLGKVTNINYSNGVLSFDSVTDAEGYNVTFIHGGEIEYQDKITSTTIDIESLGLEGNITFEVSAYKGNNVGEKATFQFSVLSKIKDTVIEAEDVLSNYGTGKGTCNYRNNSMAHNGAYVGGIDDAGQGVYFYYLCPVAGEYTLEAYYTTDMEPAHNDVWVNGTYQAKFDFTEKTGWGGATYDAAKTEVTISLVKGWNSISVMKNGTSEDNYGSYSELDYFVVKGKEETYNIDELTAEYGKRPDTYRLEAEMGSPRKKNVESNVYECKNPCIYQDDTNKYSNGFLMGGIEQNYDGVEWQFNSPTKAKYSVKVGYAAGQYDGSKKPQISFIVTQTEVGLAKNADFEDFNKVVLGELDYTGWNHVVETTNSVEITLEQGKNFIYALKLDSSNCGIFQLDYADITFVSEISENA